MAMEHPRSRSRFLFLFGGISLLAGIVLMLLAYMRPTETYDLGVLSGMGLLLAPVGLFTLVLAQVRRSQGK